MWGKLRDSRERNILYDNRPAEKQDNIVLYVCALNFGKSYSGYAFSPRHNPHEICCPSWKASMRCSISHKIPTTMLMCEGQKPIDFGYEAIEKFLELKAEERKDFNFLQRFQMNLYDQFQSGEISDFNGKQVPAVDVLSTAIKYLMDHFLNKNDAQSTCLLENDIKWVLTVPSMWGDPENQLMIQAAKKTGIKNPRLATVLESGAAFIFCKDLPAEKFESGFNNIDVFSLEQRYLVLIADDETIDATVLEVRSGGNIHVLSRASWRDCGAAMVDNTFKQIFIDIVGKEFMDSFRQNNTDDYIDMFRAFEKKNQGENNFLITGRIQILPSFLEKYKEEKGTNISKGILDPIRKIVEISWR